MGCIGRKYFVLVCVLLAFGCKSPLPTDPRPFYGCYRHDGLPFIKFDAKGFAVPEVGFEDRNVQITELKGRNLIGISQTFGLIHKDGKLAFGSVAAYTKSIGLNYELRDEALWIAPFPNGPVVRFVKSTCPS